jgi:hypothetical protein
MDELGGGWVYVHDLLWRLWDELPGTMWSDQAFVTLLSHGWDTHVACRAGSDQFRRVIPQGEAFLRAHPRSLLRPQILWLTGAAYETWWSLSLASDRDAYAHRRVYQAGAEEAHARAIAMYRALVRTYPSTRQADGARLVLPRLSLKIDTGQRRFYCVYD